MTRELLAELRLRTARARLVDVACHRRDRPAAGSRTPAAAGSGSRATLPPRTSRSSTARNLPLRAGVGDERLPAAFFTAPAPARRRACGRRGSRRCRARARRASGRRPCRCARAAPRPARPSRALRRPSSAAASSWMPNVQSGTKWRGFAIGVYGNAWPMIATGTPFDLAHVYGLNTGSSKSAVLHVLREELDLARELLLDGLLHALRAVGELPVAGHDVDAEQLLRVDHVRALASTAPSPSPARCRRRRAAARPGASARSRFTSVARCAKPPILP